MTDLTKDEYDEIMEYKDEPKKTDTHPMERKLKLYEYFDYEMAKGWMSAWLSLHKFPILINFRKIANKMGRDLGVPSQFRSSKYYNIIRGLLLELANIQLRNTGMIEKDLYWIYGIRE